MQIEKDLSEIITIIKKIKPEKIYLFGSRASGSSDEKSDIDLIIVAPSNERPLERRMALGSPEPGDHQLYVQQEKSNESLRISNDRCF